MKYTHLLFKFKDVQISHNVCSHLLFFKVHEAENSGKAKKHIAETTNYLVATQGTTGSVYCGCSLLRPRRDGPKGSVYCGRSLLRKDGRPKDACCNASRLCCRLTYINMMAVMLMIKRTTPAPQEAQVQYFDERIFLAPSSQSPFSYSVSP